MKQLIDIFPHLPLEEKAAYLFWGFCVIAFYATISYAFVLTLYHGIKQKLVKS